MIPKFRAYDGSTNRMYQPEEVLVGNENIYIDDEDFEGWTQNNDLSLMQSTGLFDKNGVEIFEGDVLDCSSIRGLWAKYFEVKYSSHGYWFIGDVNGYQSMIGFSSKDLLIVGNIYENPELVE